MPDAGTRASREQSDEHLVREDAAARSEPRAVAGPPDEAAAIRAPQSPRDPLPSLWPEAGGEASEIDPGIETKGEHGIVRDGIRGRVDDPQGGPTDLIDVRSEERRVGKECRL